MSMCEDQIRVTIIYTVKEVKGWLVPSTHEGQDGFYLHEREMPDSIFNFSACICHLLSEKGSEKFVLDTLSRIPSVSAQEWKMDIAPEVYAAAQNALKTGCSSRIDFLLETNTYEYWPLQETSAGEEWESLNGQTQGFGAVSATDYEIMMALRSKVFKKEMDHNSEYNCAICLEEFVEDIRVYQMPCLHFFHGQCIVKWLRRSNCCPYCRFRLQ